MERKIIEIKAKTKNAEEVFEQLMALGADYKGEDHQIDTYFVVPSGRLKLRQGNIENSLIQYLRTDQSDPKLSSVTLYHSNNPETLKKVLTHALGVKVVVNKVRKILFIKNVKFHIDKVKQLGTFVEIEAISNEHVNSEIELLEQCNYYKDLLNIKDQDLLKNSYSDQILDI